MNRPMLAPSVTVTRQRLSTFAWTIAGLLCVAFAVMAVEFTLAVRADRPGWWSTIQAAITTRDYTLGAGSVGLMYPTYRSAIQAMTTHTMLGGLALGLGVLQFVPAFRRRHPKIHRLVGGLVILAVAVAMVGALGYLAQTPLSAVFASPAFGLALWALSGAALIYLAGAVLAVRRRDYRSHMGFMALMMSTLLTAPVLRFEWALFGLFTPFDMRGVNQGVTSFLGLTTALIMVLWMHHVGAADLPARRREAVIAPRALRGLALLAMLVIAHEGLLAPAGIDGLTSWRTADEVLPGVAMLWAVPAILLAWCVPREVAMILNGGRVTRLAQLLAVASAAGAVGISLAHAQDSVDAIGLMFYWAALGVITVLLVAAGIWSSRRDEPWTLLWLFAALIPALWVPLLAIGWAAGQSYLVAMWFACTVGSSALAAVAFMTAFAVRLPFGRGAVAAANQNSR